VAVTSFGIRIGVRVDDPTLLAAVADRLPPGCRPSQSPEVDHLYSLRGGGPVAGTRIRRFVLAYSGSQQIARTLQQRAALDILESTIRFDLAASATGWTFVHAGAVAWKGRAIVIPGASGHGKSRLVEALVRQGATYYSDEYAVFDPDGLLHPFAKSISHRDADGGGRSITAAELGGTAGTCPVRVGLIVGTRYQADATWQPRHRSAGEGVFALLPYTFRVQDAPGEVLRTLARAVDRAGIVDGPRGEADEIVPELLGLVESSWTG
jgi:hypothetical protein